MGLKKYPLVILSILLILLIFISSASAADSNETDVLSIDKSVNSENNLLSIDTNIESNEPDNNTLKLSNDEVLTAGNNNWYVNGSVTTDGNGSINNPFNNLDKAILKAKDNDVIYIASGTYKGVDNVHFFINKPLSFIKWGDENPILDAQGNSGIFIVTVNSINIRGLTFKNGKSDYGGAIYFTNNIFNSNIDCSFVNNSVTDNGGAIYFEKDVTNCNISGDFIKNTATHNGGAIYFNGVTSGCSIVGNFTNNTSPYGGAIIFHTTVNSNIYGNFLSNNATKYGGAIYFTTVTNCNISVNSTNNTSPYGGAIYFNGNVSKSNVSGSFVNNKAEHGGAINFNCVSNSNVGGCYVNNKAEDGGAIFFGAVGVFDSNVDGLFDYNTAQNRGGAIYFENKVSNININGSFANNKAKYGGAIFAGEDDFYDHYNRSVSNSNVGGCYVNNRATEKGGAINFNMKVLGSNVCCFVNNSAGYYGGAIHFKESVSNSNVSGCYVNNSADYYGGAIHFEESVSNSNVSGCYVNNTAKDLSCGGAINFNHGVSNSNVSGCYVNNTANLGGAIHFGYNPTSNSKVIGYFEHNSARDRGGAIDFNGNVFNSNVSGCYVSNTVQDRGSAINFNYGGTIVIQDSIFINHTGNIIYVGSGNISAINCWFGNNATNYDIKPQSRNVEMVNWLFLNATANTTEITIGQTSTISFKLDAYNETSQDDVSPYNSSKMDIILKLSQTLGELNQTTALIGENLSYTAKKIGNGSVTGTFKTAYYTINFKNNGIPTNITVNTTSLNLLVDENATIGATLNPPEAGNLSFTSNDTNIATVDANGVVKAIAEGTAIITVSFPRNEQYDSAENKTINITVKLRDASVSVNNNTLDLLVDDTFNVVATTVPEGLNVTYVPDDSGVYSIDEKGVVTALKNGTGYVIVKVGGDGVYAENSTIITINVSKVPTKIELTEDDYAVYVDDTRDNLAMLQDNNGKNITDEYTLNYSSDNESIVKIVNSSFVAVSEGIANITVSFNGTDKYNPANTKIISVTVSKIHTEINVENANVTLNALDSVDANATLTPADAGNLTYTSSDENVVQVNDGKIMAIGKGTATVTVSFNGTDKYAAAESKTIQVTVNINDASVTVKDITLTVGENATIEATTTPEGLTIDYVVDDSGVVTVENGVVTAVKAGTAEITLNVGDNKTYTINSTTITVTVNKIDTSIDVENKTLELYVDDEGHIVATLNPDGGDLIFTSSDESVITVDNFGDFKAVAEGTATITVSFAGDDKYNAAENVTVTVKVSKIDTSIEFNYDTINLKVHNETIVTATLTPPEAGNVTYTSSNPSVVTVDNWGNVKAVGVGNATITASFAGNDKYNEAENVTVPVIVSKIDTKITVDTASLDLNVGNETAVKGTLTPAEAGNVSYMSNDTSVVTVDENTGKVTAVGAGNACIIVFYDGNDDYNMADDVTIPVTVSKIDTSIAVKDKVDMKVDDSVNLNATLTPADAGNITYTSSNPSVVTVDKKGNVVAVSEGTATITVSFEGNDKYLPSNATITITVSKIPTEISVNPASLDLVVGNESTIAATLTPADAGNVTFTSSDDSVVTVDEKGTVTAVGEGTATVTVSFAGDDKYTAAENITVSVSVAPKPKENATISIDAPAEASEGDNVTVTVTLPKDATGTVTIGNEIVPVKNSTASAVLTNLPAGNTTVPITYSGDDKYNPIETEVNISVKKDTSDIISAPDVTKYFSGPERFAVTVTDSKGAPLANKSVTILINSVLYTRKTNENGTASIPLGLNSDVYNVTVTMDNKTINSVVTILPTVNGTDVVKMYRNGTQYFATFRDGEGNYLKDGETVIFNIHGVMYERKVSGGKGQAKLNINLEQGEYIITAMNTVTGENAANNITVLSLLAENNDLTKYYRNASQYTVKVLGEDGKAVGAGETVKFNINGVIYERTTNASGIVKLNINLQPGDYIITAEYKGSMASNNIKVLPVLSAKDISMKYRDGTQFKATLVDGQGKPYAGQAVTFNINGVFYNRPTDSTGTSKLNINLMPGEYIITSSYNGASIANKITIRG